MTSSPAPGSRSPSPTGQLTTAAVQTINTIPADITIGPISYDVHFGRRITDQLLHDYLIEVRYTNGRILTKDDQSEEWIGHAQVARDRHEQNIEITRNKDGHLFYRSLKTIQAPSKLCFWYSDQLAREIGIPVLTPRQIKGDQTYCCDRCFKSFLYPNCLKSHMRYHCNSPMPPVLSQPTIHPVPGHHPPMSFSFGRISPPRSSNSVSPHDMSTRSVIGAPRAAAAGAIQLGVNSAFVPPIPRIPNHHSLPPSARLSPMKSSSPTTAGDQDAKLSAKDCQPIQIFNHIHPPALIPMDYSALKYYYPLYQSFAAASRLCCPAPQSCSVAGHCSHPMPHPYLFPFGAANNNNHVEANRLTSPVYNSTSTKTEEPPSTRFKFPLPSDKAGEPLDLIPRSMYISKSRKGHLCIYCGKLYSRKYGLKIHLRTHTGYKPLKCKVCLRPFGDPSNLNKHIRLHAEGDTPYRCDHCGKVLVRRRDLERHIKSRHPNEAETDNTIKPFSHNSVVETEIASEIKIENTTDEIEDQDNEQEDTDEIIDVGNDLE
ncbi:PR domain zinc finger protein 13-like [Tubulanus polymorphus]|uniref:PR domain zinc finger protein 13-like n=1 Tax=Tubulanus polymorphus TaxID=672921 RepID=UPI003DA49EC9